MITGCPEFSVAIASHPSVCVLTIQPLIYSRCAPYILLHSRDVQRVTLLHLINALNIAVVSARVPMQLTATPIPLGFPLRLSPCVSCDVSQGGLTQESECVTGVYPTSGQARRYTFEYIGGVVQS